MIIITTLCMLSAVTGYYFGWGSGFKEGNLKAREHLKELDSRKKEPTPR